MTNSEKIENNPSYSKLREEMKGFKVLSGFMGLFGFGNGELRKLKQKFPELKNQLDELSTVPDKFNKHFGEFGWIAHESINFDTMKEAVELAENDNLKKAEEVLIELYNPSNIQLKVHWLKQTDAFHIRYDLILKALEDYKQERYHACIPVVLMLTDGAVNDITKSKGLFAEGTELTAWDSISGHSTGLTVLKNIFTVGRNKTSVDEITMPYRNGILHGRDLGYANKVVAAKSWATMFAIHDWAVALKKNGKEAPEALNEKKGLLDNLKEIANIAQEYGEHKKNHKAQMQKIETWESREMQVGKDFQEKVQSIDLITGSPEKCAIEFIEFWAAKNYGKMAKHMDYRSSHKESIGKLAGKMREQFESFSLESFKLVQVKDQSPAISEIVVCVKFSEDDQKKTKDLPLRLIYENKEGTPMVRGQEESNWKIMDQNFWKLYG